MIKAVNEIVLESDYKVVAVNKRSRARYALGVKVEDIITLNMTIEHTAKGGSSQGNYALYARMDLNGLEKAWLSQNEIPKLLDIFDLVEVKKRYD